MRALILLIFLLNFAVSYCQGFDFAVVDSKDGFVNVRSSASKNDKNIVEKVQNGFVVAVFGVDGNWLEIDYEINGKERSGFIYKSGVANISSFKKIPKSKVLKGKVIFSDGEIEVAISISDFDKKLHRYKYHAGNSKQLVQIDDKEIFGTDGDFPKIEYRSISINVGSKETAIPKEQLQNLYEPNFEHTRVNYDVKNKTLYIQSLNSDGAGGYAVIWIIENGVFKKRIISRGF